MRLVQSGRPIEIGLNHRPFLGGLAGAVLGGTGAGVVAGGPPLALALVLSASNSGGLSSAHGLSGGEMVLMLLLAAYFLGPSFAIAGALGGAIAGATNKPTSTGIALGAAGAAPVLGLLLALWIGAGNSRGSDAALVAFAFAGGLLIGAIGGSIGGALRKGIGAD